MFYDKYQNKHAVKFYFGWVCLVCMAGRRFNKMNSWLLMVSSNKNSINLAAATAIGDCS